MAGSPECSNVLASLPPYVEGTLDTPERSTLDDHLRACPGCRDALKRFGRVQAFARGTLGQRALGERFNETTGQRLHAVAVPAEAAVGASSEQREASASLFERLGAAPWWGVSVALHVLIIILLGLITMSIGTLENGDLVVVLTSLEQRKDMKLEENQETKRPESRDLLKREMDVPPTDPDSTVTSNIVVPPDILAQAELGDHFETINLDRPDTQSAFGNPEARMFHSVSGNDEPEGGGGSGGAGTLLDDLIGLGGAGTPGTGGGWGGGNGTGIGIGTGSGRGSFGQRDGGGRRLMVMRHGGGKATESAVDAGLDWLARHQDQDGHWNTQKFGARDNEDVAFTGMALLAFLGAGHSEKVGKYKDNVKRAIDWLISKQLDDGSLMPANKHHLGYAHAMAGMSLAEASAMGRVQRTRDAAQKAINYSVEKHQAGEGSEKRGYRYAPKQEPADISNHGWFVMHVKSAKVAGLTIPAGGVEGAIWFLGQVEEKAKVGGDEAYGGHRYFYGPNNPAGISPRRTAIGCLCRQFMGTPREELQGGVEWFIQKGGVPKANVVDLYYWYYGTLCAFQQGGDTWQKWNEGLKGTLLPAQCKGGDEDGSWAPTGQYAGHWGRVGQTALSILCLEVYYRYLPMYRE